MNPPRPLHPSADDDDYADEDDVNGNVALPEPGTVTAATGQSHASRNGQGPDDTPAPYAGLTPDTVLDAMASIGLHGDGRMLSLNSYENRVYQLYLDALPGEQTPDSVVTKFYRPQRWSDAAILEEHAFVAELAEREIPVVPALQINGHSLHTYQGFRFAVFPRRGGRTPELESRETLEWIGRFIGRIHAVGALKPYRERPTLDIANFGEEPRDWLLANHFIPDDLREAWESVVSLALDGVRRAWDRAGQFKNIRLHGDCHSGNVLWTEMHGSAIGSAKDFDNPRRGGPHFVDFDDSRMGPAIQDLWMLLPGERRAAIDAMSDVLAGYEDFCDFNPRQLHLIEALRTLRLLHYSAWIARRWHDPAFPAAFPWFNTQRYWQDRILELREQVGLMQEPPLWSN